MPTLNGRIAWLASSNSIGCASGQKLYTNGPLENAVTLGIGLTG